MPRINFTNLPDRLNYPRNVRAVLSTMHSTIVSYVSENYKNTISFRRLVVQVMNTVSYRVVSGDSIPDSWSNDRPLEWGPCESDITLKHHLSKIGLYIDESDVLWDVQQSDDAVQDLDVRSNDDNLKVARSTPSLLIPTPKENLYIRPPVVPMFDYSSPFVSSVIDGEQYTIYTSLPEVPTKQNEISATTDVNKFTDYQLVALFPNTLIRTRDPSMYEKVDGLELDPDLGVLLKIRDFSRDEVRDNIIKYPHIFQLKKVLDDGSVVTFYKTIEVNGELVKLQDVWYSMPDTKNVPMLPEFMKEYSVRRYLLERDVLGIHHRYPMFGSLDPFLTLFAPAEKYKELGYCDAVSIARKCVLSRVSYKQSRNPILRRIRNE